MSDDTPSIVVVEESGDDSPPLEGEAERQDLHCLCECRKVLHEVYTGENAKMIVAVENAIVRVAKAISKRYQGV